MSARRSSLLIGTVALSACASVLGLPDEYSGGSDHPGADASADAPVEAQPSDAEAGADGDAGPPDDAADGAPAAETGPAEAGADAEAGTVTPPAIVGLAAGMEHACAIVLTDAQTQDLRCWGNCGNDRLGRACTNGIAPSPIPMYADSSLGFITNALAVAAAMYSTCTVLTTGTVVCWGDCAYGQLGNPTACPDSDAGTNDRSEFPVPVLDPSGPLANIRAVAGYANQYCALSNADEAFCWGAREWENALEPSAWSVRATLQSGLPDAGLGPLAVGSRHACVVADEAVRCWGNNHGGQLGFEGDASAQPVIVSLGGVAADVSGGDEHSCATVGQDRSVRCWGSWEGPTPAPNPSGVLVDGGVLKDIWSLSGAYHFSCGLDAAGHVLCWGQHPERWAGKPPSGSTPEYVSPFMVETAPNVPLAGMKYVAGGGNFACAASDDEAYCWGNLSYEAGSVACDPGIGVTADCAVYAKRIDNLP